MLIGNKIDKLKMLLLSITCAKDRAWRVHHCDQYVVAKRHNKKITVLSVTVVTVVLRPMRHALSLGCMHA